MDVEDAAPGVDDGDLRSDRLRLFKEQLSKNRPASDDPIFFKDLLQLINKGLTTGQLFGSAEATLACKAMEAEDKLMMSDEVVYII